MREQNTIRKQGSSFSTYRSLNPFMYLMIPKSADELLLEHSIACFFLSGEILTNRNRICNHSIFLRPQFTVSSHQTTTFLLVCHSSTVTYGMHYHEEHTQHNHPSVRPYVYVRPSMVSEARKFLPIRLGTTLTVSLLFVYLLWILGYGGRVKTFHSPI